MPAPHASTDRTVLARRCSAQLLTGEPARDATAAVDRLLAVQAQDARGARLAVRARTVGVTADDVDRAMTLDRSLVITWLNRGTLHLVRAEDYWWLRALTTPQLATSTARRLGQEGVGPEQAERGVGVIESVLADEGPLTRAALRERLAARDIPVAGQALVHLLVLASLRGLIVRGPVVDGDHAFVLVRDWWGPPPALPSREVMLGELALRYLRGHGPARDDDLAKWAGIPLGAARAALTQVHHALEVDAHGRAWIAGAAGGPDALPSPRLLGPFDPLLMGWRSRDLVLPVDGGVVTSNGIFRAVALVGGIAVATWSLRAGRVTIGAPFGRLSAADRAALGVDAEAVLTFLGSGHPRGGSAEPTVEVEEGT